MNRVIAGLGLAVLLLLAVGLIALSVVGGSVGSHLADGPTASTTAPPGSTTTVARSDVDKVVAEIEGFVSATRQRSFKRGVPVTLLDGAAFKDRLLADDSSKGDARKQIELAQRTLRAIGLLDAKVDLYEVSRRFVSDAVVGFYDAKAHELVVRGGSLTPYARSVLAHELTHALDDQWFGIERPDLDEPGNDEAASAFQALVEGNAVRVQAAYLSHLSVAERVQAAAEEQRAAAAVDLKGVPDVLPELVNWPYEFGPPFVQALLRAGGERRVDAAFEKPPTTTAQIAEPGTYLQPSSSATVTVPKADGPVLDSGIFGYASLIETLEPVVGTNEATTAASGWSGDAYVLWDAGGGRSCVRATFVMRTAADLAQLSRSLADWAADRHATLARGAGSVGFTACG